MSYIWQIKDKAPKEFLDKFPELPPIVVQLLYNRELKTQEAIDEFLLPDYSQDVHDPFLFKDMQRACRRIYEAITKQELITVYADYDADGVSAAVILKSILTDLGAKINVYLPHREKEGYGLNLPAIEEIAKNGTQLIITCDCAISNVEEVALANSQGLDVIITDHHAIPLVLPQAYAIIHPQLAGETYPFKFLAGGGVAFKLAQALLKHADNKFTVKDSEVKEKWLLDMVAISTVADMVPLLGENRTLVKHGLIVLRKTRRVGLQLMIKVAGIDTRALDANSIAFSIAPRINTAGRMDHANLAYYLLTTTDPEKATEMASSLNQNNIDRQRVTEQIIREAKMQEINLEEKLLVFYKADWPAGLISLAANRLLREYNRPCLVVCGQGDKIVASARSFPEFDINWALEENKNLLERFGGHPQAAGFTVRQANYDQLLKNLKNLAEEKLKNVALQNKLLVEKNIALSQINWELLDWLKKFEPYGQANPEPIFSSENVLVSQARKVGSDGQHWKLELTQGEKRIGGIAFGQADFDLAIGHRVDLAYNINVNEWNGNREVQLKIKDLRQHDSR
ncbi:MAG: single-stranded-DNA-specific exonuclease RecJ [Patescibacteria group bacterium]